MSSHLKRAPCLCKHSFISEQLSDRNEELMNTLIPPFSLWAARLTLFICSAFLVCFPSVYLLGVTVSHPLRPSGCHSFCDDVETWHKYLINQINMFMYTGRRIPWYSELIAQWAVWPGEDVSAGECLCLWVFCENVFRVCVCGVCFCWGGPYVQYSDTL